MIDFTSFPATNADDPVELDNLKFNTFSTTERSDEKTLYQQLNNLLAEYENSTEIDIEEISNIRKKTKMLQVLIDEKEEMYHRINWLEQLYKVNEEIESIQTRREAEKLYQVIYEVQTCPLKTKLQQRLEKRITELPSESEEISQELFMDQAIEEIGSEFIDLGTNGREAVIATATREGFLDMKKVKQETRNLESNVMQLQTCKSVKQMSDKLDYLPLSSWKDLNMIWKLQIATYLLKEEQHWNGLAMLDRLIYKQVRKMQAEQTKQGVNQNIFEVPGGIAASVIDCQKLEFDNLWSK